MTPSPVHVLALAALFLVGALARPAFAGPPAALERALASVVRIEPAWAAGTPPPPLSRSLGSGFVLDAEGRLATNAHVVGEARAVTVVFADGARRPARVLGVDRRVDVAVLQVDGPTRPLPAAPARPRLGERVHAIGSPLGFDFSVTEGIVAGFDRAYDAVHPVDFLQHDAALNPGSSGGPLIDARGRVVGMNTATPGETLFDIGIGLAIPIDQVRLAARILIAGGRPGELGVAVRAADAAMLAALGVTAEAGLIIEEARPGGAAAAAGLGAGAVLLAVEGAGTALPRDLAGALVGRAAGETVRLTVAGPGGVAEVAVRLGPVAGAAPPPARAEAVLGLRLVSRVDGGTGALVNDVARGSLAETYGLRRDDVVLAVNGQAVDGPAAAERALATAGELAVLRVRRPGRGERHLALPLTAAAAERRPPGLPADQTAQL